MQLRDHLYHITAREQQDDKAIYHIALQADHVIYKAHFPGQPITPGVVILQMAAELAGDMLRSKGTLSSAGLGCSLSDRAAYQAAPATPASPTPSIAAVKNVKFLSVLSPTDTPEAIFRLKVKSQEDDQTSLQVTVEAGDHPIAKLSFTLWTQQK